ncbi:GNAT family N-acetyltransferase [Alicyclobacillus sp. ALC3]|uniref:GNAT family N-acetyltransferase n=1 Tax=Alicyclobacillus sp. ALC3 TaxID=2796143 RepID=UPI003082F13F
MRLQSKGIYLRLLNLDDARDLLDLRVRNRAFLQPWEPIQSDDHFTLARQTDVIEKAIANWGSGSGYAFGIFLVDTDDLIGRVNLSNVVRGAWESCRIGYFLDQPYNGRGYMTEAVRLAVRFAFDEANLHRVQAAVMPRNK